MIHVDKADGCWTATIDRPDKANSLTAAMLGMLADTAEAAADEARVFVLTGTGRVFSAGADLDEAPRGLATDPVWERLSGAIAALPCLTICALNGTLAGGAFGMALACDLRRYSRYVLHMTAICCETNSSCEWSKKMRTTNFHS